MARRKKVSAKKSVPKPASVSIVQESAPDMVAGSPVPKTSPAPSPENMCAGCDAPCCVRLRAELTVYDVARIVALEKQDPAKFLLLAETDDDDALFIRILGKRLKLIMAKKDGNCVFLKPGAALKCAIDLSKPSICTAYPLKFLWKGQNGYLEKTLCPSENLKQAESAIPAKVLDDARWEWQRHMEIVHDWNKLAQGDEGLDRFFAFAAIEMDSEKTPLGSLMRRARRILRMS